jgi:putative ABC transport system substrate-binding protein
MIRRREFITLLGGAAATWPLAARAQPAKLPTVGLLVPGTPAFFGQRVAACTQRLRELGWIEGRTVAIEYRWAEAQRFDEIVNEFVRLKVDVIFTGGTPPVIAAQKATSNIPIVFVAAGDPVGTGARSRQISAGWRSWLGPRMFPPPRRRAKFRQQQRHSRYSGCPTRNP